MTKKEQTYLDQITVSGMKGRKIETKVNRWILTLVFLLFSGAVILLSSFQKTQKQQRLEDYGEWKVAEYGIRQEMEHNDLSAMEINADTAGHMDLYGFVLDEEGTKLSGIGSMDTESKEIGRIKLKEGKWPAKENEVAVELHVLNQLHYSYNIGQKIKVMFLHVPKSVSVAPELIQVESKKKKGTVTYQFINIETGEPVKGCSVVKKEYTVTGILEDYSDKWAVGENQLLPGIVMESGESEMDVQETHSFYCSSLSYNKLENVLLEEETFQSLRDKTLVVNTYAGGQDAMGKLLLYVILGTIFVVAVYAVFQTFTTQMKKRTRRICLLKGIGATKKQIAYTIRKEAVLLLRFAFPVGVLTGSIGGILSIFLIGRIQQRQICISCNIPLFIISLLLGIVAVFAGMLIPLRKAAGVPLVGSFQVQAPKKKKKRRKRNKRRQTFFSITMRHQSANKAGMFLSVGMAMFSGILVSLSIFTIFFQFNEYRYHEKNTPQYQVNEIKGEENPDLRKVNAISGVRCSIGQWIVPVSLSYKKMSESPIFQDRKKEWEVYRKELNDSEEAFEEFPEVTELCIEDSVNPEVYQAIYNATEENNGEAEAFQKGEQVLVYVPDYRYETKADVERLNGLYGISSDESEEYLESKEKEKKMTFAGSCYLKRKYKRDRSLKVGDTITLKTENGKKVQKKVGGILRYSTSCPYIYAQQPYTIFASSGIGKEFCQGTYYDVDVYTDKNATYEATDKKVASVFQNCEWSNYHTEQQEMYERAVYSSVLIGILGVCAILIALFIQYNNVKSKLGQEEKRIGILRSMGVTKKQMRSAYFAEGMLYALAAVLAGGAVFLVCMVLKGSVLTDLASSSIDIGGKSWRMFYEGYITFTGYWKETMDGYPLLLHALLGVVLFAVLISIQVIPLRKALRKSVTENIRELGE